MLSAYMLVASRSAPPQTKENVLHTGQEI